MSDKKNFNLVLHTVNGPMFIQAAASSQNDLAQHLLSCMSKNSVATFFDEDGTIKQAFRSQIILGFDFQDAPPSEEVVELHNRRLQLEIQLMEKNLEKLRSGDEWKDGGDWGSSY